MIKTKGIVQFRKNLTVPNWFLFKKYIKIRCNRLKSTFYTVIIRHDVTFSSEFEYLSCSLRKRGVWVSMIVGASCTILQKVTTCYSRKRGGLCYVGRGLQRGDFADTHLRPQKYHGARVTFGIFWGGGVEPVEFCSTIKKM